MNEPVLSVCLITYNQVKFIRDAIEGVLNQKVNFSWELVIADDCSTDGTREILLEYKDRHPSFITLILQDHNVGPAKNWMDLVTYPKSKYIAYFEGDDYWKHPDKLQMQVDFLEKNPEYGVVFTDADHLHAELGLLIPSYDRTNKRKIPQGDVLDFLLYDNPYKTCTSLFKRKYIDDLGKIAGKTARHEFKMGDAILWIMIASMDKIGYLPMSTVVYRLHHQSASHSADICRILLFAKSSYKRSVFFADYLNLPVNKNKLKAVYRNYIIAKCMTDGHYAYLHHFSFHGYSIARIFIKEKLIRRLLIKMKG